MRIAATVLTDALKIVEDCLSHQYCALQIPGFAAGIIYRDNIVFAQGYGYADIHTEAPMTPATGVQVASISKLFTAAAVMKLVEENKLTLDERVQKYLPGFTSSEDKQLRRITVRQLLTHSSGLKRDGDFTQCNTRQFPLEEEFRMGIQGKMTVFPVKKQFKYSNLGFAVLGQVIRQVTGTPFNDYINTTIIQTLSLEHTFPDLMPQAEINLATGYAVVGPDKQRRAVSPVPTHSFSPAMGFISNVYDLCQFLKMHYTDGQLLQETTLREMRGLQSFSKDGRWGLGCEISGFNGNMLYGHRGVFFGSNSYVAYDPLHNLGFVVLANAMDAPAEEFSRVMSSILYSVIEDHHSRDRTSLDLTTFSGTFCSDSLGTISIRSINQHLVKFYPSARFPLAGSSRLKHKEGNIFVMETGSGFDYVGEDVVFIDNGVKIGPNFYERRRG